jgi:hypothetical protein
MYKKTPVIMVRQSRLKARVGSGRAATHGAFHGIQ